MDGPKESSPAANTRIKGVLSKARRGTKDEPKDEPNMPSISIHDTSSEGPGSTTGVRSSLDSLGERIRASRQSSLDDGTGSNKLAKLIPGHKKRAKKRQEAAGQQLAEELGVQRGRSISDQRATAADLAPSSRNLSRTTLDDGESSLITVDSERDVS